MIPSGPTLGVTESQRRGFLSVQVERARQDAKWGVQYHSVIEWLAILNEEQGELAQQCLRSHFGNVVSPELRAEAVQVAAVALAFIEAIDERRIRR